MKTLFLRFLIFMTKFYFVSSSFNYQDATCSTTMNEYANYSIDLNTILYFRSPEFPKSMMLKNDSDQIFCNAHFHATGNNSQLLFLLYNGALGSLSISDGIDPKNDKAIIKFENSYVNFTSTEKDIFFNFNNGIFPKWTAFEAIIYPIDKNSTQKFCPLSYQTLELEKDKPYPIMAYFQTEDIFGCTWTFKIDPSLVLKLVIKKFGNDDPDFFASTLELRTDGDTVETFDDPIESDNPKVFYYPSESGIFKLSFTMFDDDASLVAIVSAVENLTIPISNECPSNTNTNSTDLFFLNYDYGYSAYDSCYYSCMVPSKSEVILYVEEMFVEKNVDSVILSADFESPIELEQFDTYHLTSDVENPVIEFKADGNIQQAGFKITKKILECQCSSSEVVIPCSESFEITASLNSTAYCMQQQCNYTISLNESCAAKYLKFTFSFNLFEMDTIILYLNQNKQEEYTNTTKIGARLFSKTSNIYLSFFSQETSSIQKTDKSWSIDVLPQNDPNITKISLNNSMPYFIPLLNEMKENDAFVICTAPNDTMEVHLSGNQNELSYFVLYDSNGFENFVGDLNLLPPRRRVSFSGCFTLWNGGNDVSAINVIALFSMQKGNNCKNPQNIFIVKENDENISFNEATSMGHCMIVLLAETPVIRFNEIITSSNDTYAITSPVNENTYFEINSFASSNWRDTTIYANALKILIPPSQSLNISTTALIVIPDKTVAIKLSLQKQQGILASPSYSGSTFLQNDSNKFIQLYELKSCVNYEYTFFVKSIAGNVSLLLQNSLNENITLTANQTVTQSDKNFKLFYCQQNPSTDNFIILYTAISPTPNISLTIETPYQTFWLDDLKTGNYILACAPGDKIEMFFPYFQASYFLSTYILYDGIGFDNKIGTFLDIVRNADDDDYPIHIASTLTNCFTIKNINGSNSYLTLLFRMKNKKNQFCNGKNIFQQISQNFYEQNISLSVVENGEKCEIIILSKYPYSSYDPKTNINNCDFSKNDYFYLSCAPFVYLRTIYGTSEIYKIKDATNENVFAEINDTDVSQWRNVLIYTNALSVTVTGDVFIDISYNGEISDVLNIKGFLTSENPIQKGIFASPSYSGLPDAIAENNNILYNITSNKTLALNLNIKRMDSTVWMTMDGKEYQIAKNVTLFGSSYQLFQHNESAHPFLIEYSLLNVNKNIQITLNTDSPTHVLWLDDLEIYDMIAVCSVDSDDLQLFIPTNNISLTNFVLYDRNTNIGSLQSDFFTRLSTISPRQITSSSGCFRIQKIKADKSFISILFRLKYANGTGCATPNILEASSSLINNTASALSNSECEIILLTSSQEMSPIIYLSSIRATSKDIITVKSTINRNVLAEIGGDSADEWKDLYLFTPVLSVVITKGTSIFFSMSSVNSDKIMLQNFKAFQKGVIASYTYNGFKKMPTHVEFINKNCSINFNVNYLSATDDAVILKSGNDSHIFTQNDNFTTHGQSLELSSSSSFSISYEILECSSLFESTSTQIYSTTHKNGSNVLNAIYTQFLFTFLLLFLY